MASVQQWIRNYESMGANAVVLKKYSKDLKQQAVLDYLERYHSQWKKTTFEKRVELVQYCITHACNYARTTEQYQVSYHQARSYTVKYEPGGVEALRENRGKQKSPEKMNELEKSHAKVRKLTAEKDRAEMETSF